MESLEWGFHLPVSSRWNDNTWQKGFAMQIAFFRPLPTATLPVPRRPVSPRNLGLPPSAFGPCIVPVERRHCQLLLTSAARALTLAALVSALHVSAADWYLAPPPAGSDTNPGTSNFPFGTLQHAITNAATYGDTIRVLGGTYQQPTIIDSWSKPGGSVNNRLHIIADDDNNKPIFSGTETLVGTWMDVPKPLVRVYTEAEYPPQQATPFHRDDAITNSDSTVGVWKLSPITYRHPQVIYVENAGTENETRTVLKQVGWSSPLGTWIYQNFGSDANPIWNPAELRGLILTDMVDWTFFWASNALYIRVPSSKPSPNDPSVRIEASRYHPLDAVVVDYLHLKGITFRHSSTINDDGFDGLAGVALGFGCLIEDCNVEWMDSEGLNIRVNGEIRNCTVAFNGRTGLGANGSLNGPFTLTNTLVISNNWRGFEVCHHCGGAKIIADSDYGGSVIVDNRFIGNNGPGLWLDSVRNNSSPVIVSNNLSAFNMPSGSFARTSYFVPYSTNGVTYTISHCGAGGGFLLEFGARIHAINNIVATNAGYGIGLASTKDSKVLHNTVVTGAEGVAFYMVAEPGRWACTGNDIRNNIFLQNYADIYFPGEAFPGMSVEGGSIDGLNGGAYVNVVALSLLDYNCYYATVSGSPAEFGVG